MALWIGAIAVAVLGLAAAAAGWRGRRVNEHPICRGCGFDLVGLEGVVRDGGQGGTDLRAGQWHGRCPECGRDLRRRRAVRQGERRRRRVVLAAGLVMFLGGAVWTGALVWGRAQGFDWNTVKPTWLLVIETRQPAGENADAGMKELVKRLEAGKVGAAAISTIVEQVLEGQGDLELPWHGSWGDFVEEAHGRDLLNDEQRQRYVRQALAGAITPYQMNYRNESVRWGLEVGNIRAGSAVGRAEAFRARVLVDSVAIGDQTLDTGMLTMPGLQHRRFGTTTTLLRDVKLAPGTHDVELRGRVSIIEGTAVDSEPIASWPLVLETTLDVPAEGPITWIDDPELAPVFQKGHPQTPEARAVQGGARIDGFMHFESVPVGMVARVFFREGEREWEVGRLNLRPGGGIGINIMSSETLPDFNARTVDIILRTVVDEEPDASWPSEVWRGELVIPDVPLRWVGEGGS